MTDVQILDMIIRMRQKRYTDKQIGRAVKRSKEIDEIIDKSMKGE